MTDKPTPTDEELKAMWQIHAADIGGILDFARAVLAKWGSPSGATEEVENLRKALVYAAFALHGTPQYMLAQGITLIDGDTVRVSRDGWTVEASVNPHRQPAPATQQAVDNSRFDYKTAADFLSGKTVSDEALRKFVAASRGAHGDRAALRAQMLTLRGVLASREAEIALLKRSLLDAEAAAPQPSTTAQAAQPDSVLEDAARYRFLRDGEWRDTDLEPFIRLQLNTLWDAKIDAARARLESKP